MPLAQLTSPGPTQGEAGAGCAARATSILAGVLVALVPLTLSAPDARAATPSFRSLGDGAWSWFGDPRAVHHKGAYQRTYVGWVDHDGNIEVASYDHRSRLRTTVVLHPALHTDDHANPSLHVRPDGRLLIFYSGHNMGQLYYRVSRQPEDITSWEEERTVPTNSPGGRGYTYPNPVRLKAEGDLLYLFWRGGDWHPTFSTSPDDASWSPARKLIDVEAHRPYVKYASNGWDTIHFAFTDGHPRNLKTSIYYANYRDGALHRADGATIKPMSQLPLAPGEVDTVYDTAYKTWIHDVAVDELGRPVVVFAVFPSDAEHEYHYARWTGRWVSRPITGGGGAIDETGREPHYSGGITLDHDNPDVVYLSREVAGMHEVEQWSTTDGGATWSRHPITSASAMKNARPVSPRGLVSFSEDVSVVWMRGGYDHYLAYRTEITTRLLNGGNLPPLADFAHSARRGSAPLAVDFDAATSRDPDGSIADWTWDFGDGGQGAGRSIRHTYVERGRYFPRLTVTDAMGDRDVFVSEVVVE